TSIERAREPARWIEILGAAQHDPRAARALQGLVQLALEVRAGREAQPQAAARQWPAIVIDHRLLGVHREHPLAFRAALPDQGRGAPVVFLSVARIEVV